MLHVEVLAEKDRDDVLRLQEDAVSEMGIAFHAQPDEVISCTLSGNSLGCFDDDKLVAIRLCCVKHIPDEFLPKLPIEEEAPMGAYMCGVYVHPDYRKHGLARRLVKETIVMQQAVGVKHFFVTVHPENKTAFHVLQDCGFSIVYEGLFYGSKPRYLMYLTEKIT